MAYKSIKINIFKTLTSY